MSAPHTSDLPTCAESEARMAPHVDLAAARARRVLGDDAAEVLAMLGLGVAS